MMSVGYVNILKPPMGISSTWATTRTGYVFGRKRTTATTPATSAAMPLIRNNWLRLRREIPGSFSVAMGEPFLWVHEVTDLQTRLQHAKDGVAGNHAADVPAGDDRHLRDVVRLHAFEHGEHGFFG